MNLTDPAELKVLLERHGLSPTKRLGQHFLVSDRVVNLICTAAAEAHPGSILEVGPGPGVLTQRLCELAPTTAIEVDETAVAMLRETSPKARLIAMDVLKIDLGVILKQMYGETVVVSNMPYRITGPLLTKFTRARDRAKLFILMMQKEVAGKIMAAPGDRDFGSISVYLQTRFEIRMLCKAPAGAFFPPPKVDSLVLVLTPKPWAFTCSDDHHEQVVRQGFAQPRKTLANNIGRESIADFLAQKELSASIRPHQLTLEQWADLAEWTDGSRAD